MDSMYVTVAGPRFVTYLTDYLYFFRRKSFEVPTTCRKHVRIFRKNKDRLRIENCAIVRSIYPYKNKNPG